MVSRTVCGLSTDQWSPNNTFEQPTECRSGTVAGAPLLGCVFGSSNGRHMAVKTLMFSRLARDFSPRLRRLNLGLSREFFMRDMACIPAVTADRAPTQRRRARGSGRD